MPANSGRLLLADKTPGLSDFDPDLDQLHSRDVAGGFTSGGQRLMLPDKGWAQQSSELQVVLLLMPQQRSLSLRAWQPPLRWSSL